MKQSFCILFLFVLFANLSFAQDAFDLADPYSGSVIFNEPGSSISYWPGDASAVIFDNGGIVNFPGGGFGGADRSSIESALGHTLFGWGHQIANNNSMADDFTVPTGEVWNIDQLITLAYQTGSTTTSTINDMRIQIWSGSPMMGGTIIWGDLTTNRLSSTVWANIYRTTETDPNNTQRPVMRQTSTIGTSLPPGQYWVQWQAGGTLASGPWCPPVTILGVAVTGDALQNVGGTWQAALNGTSPNGAPFILVGSVVPVELTSFTAYASFGQVELSWITSTETNNQGFEIQRNSGNEYEAIAFVPGFGTTTQTQAYSYVDKNVVAGTYKYRLKQIDFDGSFKYSEIVEVDVPAPVAFSLEQNYPNPFNPSTKITFSLASDSKVSLKVFNVLGQEIASLINQDMSAGIHNIDFVASDINSGVYFYKIDANGIDGKEFSATKKMILTK